MPLDSLTAHCRHCGQPLMGAATERGAFCCQGCAGAYTLIHDLGLDAYYDRRPAEAAAPAVADDGDGADPLLGLPDAVAVAPDGSCLLRLSVDGLHCGACLWLIEAAVTKHHPEVRSARANLTTRCLTLRWTGAPAQAVDYARLVTGLGYRVAPFGGAGAGADPAAAQERALLRRLALAGFAAANVMLLSVSVWSGADAMGDATRTLLHWVSALIALPTVAIAGQPFFQSALAALRAGRTNMDVPISVGVLLTTGMSVVMTAQHGEHAYFDGAVMLLFFLLVGRYLDSRARGRARSAAAHLLALNQAPVTVLDADGLPQVVPPARVSLGATVLVAAGERIGVDGTVAEGVSDLDASLVTGETLPLAVAPGAQVFAGMINRTAPLRLTATASGEGTLLAEMVRLLEAAEQGRARHVLLADRIARAYTPVVHLTALTTFLAWVFLGHAAWYQALLIAVSVLIITCPCALALAVPAVQVTASGRLMRQGILLKSATALERLAPVDTVVFDKTGTLTLGRPDLLPDPTLTAAELELAARLARASRHPLSRALARAAGPGPVAEGVVEVPGGGLRWRGPQGFVRLGSRAFCGVTDADDEGRAGPELWFSRCGQPPRRFLFADRPRRDAAAVVAELKAAGYRVELLSGDRAVTAQALAAEVGIDIVRADARPADKCAHLAALRAEGRNVLMVGDGLNDAAALAAADVSLSPASAVDVTQTAADVVFQGDGLAAVAETLAVARRARALVRQNLAFTLLYNLCAVPVAMAGLATPFVAAAAMSGSSLAVMANALRLGGKKSPDGGQ
ncbi:heavy metal translocating P-type ATPase metal-binding domain-containing protein [Nitrospirillum sp. BR 11163]|uniref:heavy metal translocating P-type ATPase metal-binding domain-containing protein n=1 Tax=Nitrospirillum sp. BR 11163 TaxID=3104323 RepID=UPI002AFE1B72|nr:heavy metal translocating P-type ATPase metal-binding domain-containing protein [Nitrospirillum sp. BR 11163]MEA1676124.1 heavy metal translocating P-type ATPase metal-binding domain-containing protein [Nitrospirillum sp. BR 11163]